MRAECVWLQLRSHVCFMREIERIKTAVSENYEYDRKLEKKKQIKCDRAHQVYGSPIGRPQLDVPRHHRRRGLATMRERKFPEKSSAVPCRREHHFSND